MVWPAVTLRALGVLRLEDCQEFEASLDCIARPCFRNPRKTEREEGARWERETVGVVGTSITW